jgi:predicted nucleic acid-binding protein
MIYLDTSVALAYLLAKDRRPPDSLWHEPIISSRLLQYETWTRINNLGLAFTHGEDVRELLGRVAFVELAPPVLERALEPFPVSVRTLDAIHLASAEFLQRNGQEVHLASFDGRLVKAARALGFEILEL